MGYALGQLYGEEIIANINGMVDYYMGQVTRFLKGYGLPDVLALALTEVAKKIAFAAVDLNYEIAKPYMPARITDEMQGIHDGSNGVADYKMVRRINFLPEIIKAQCTIAGAFGAATKDGNLLHLRALDWDHNAPVDKYPAIVIYEPTEEGS